MMNTNDNSMSADSESSVSKNIRKSSLITTWQPNLDDPELNDIKITHDGKIMYMLFDKVLKQPHLEVYRQFHIKKESYVKQLPVIVRYLNFFMSVYDTDNELIMAYLKLKFLMERDIDGNWTDDKTQGLQAEQMPNLVDFIYEFMFTDTMIDKINRMVEDNYLDDIESDSEKKMIAREKKHLESLEFTNQHIKILLKISFGMKCITPVLLHFATRQNIKITKDDDIIFSFYKRLFTIFGTDDGVNMYNKLFIYVKAKVLEAKSKNNLSFEQREIMGVDDYNVIDRFLKRVLISENMVKYKFNEHWVESKHAYEENIVGFNKTILKYQLSYFLKETYAKNLTEVTYTKNSDGLSGMDKMEMNLSKLDEGLVIMADNIIKDGIDRLLHDNDFNITEDEVDYYVKHHVPSKTQIILVYSYFSKMFGGYANLHLLTRREYITILLVLKKKLLIESGYMLYEDETDRAERTKLAYILTGNLDGKLNTRIIRNNRFISKVEESYLYNNLINNKYASLHQIKPDYILSLLSSFINSQFSYVIYEDPDMLGKPIDYSEDKISDEMLFFLNSI